MRRPRRAETRLHLPQGCKRQGQSCHPAPKPLTKTPQRSPMNRLGRGGRSMLELMLCSLFPLLPDYLYRRYGPGKRFGREITFYSFWYEFRYGITTCLMLTIALITTIFYFHPSTTSVTAFFRTVPILPETNGRVAEIYVGHTGEI